jgi:hypothetical protein
MTKTLVLQSAPAQRPQWLDTCLVSVESWAAETGYAYRFIGDELEPVSSCLFGQELWIQKNLSKGSAKSGEKPQRQKGKWQARKNVHNALAAFRKGCPVLPFLIEVIQRMMRRVDANFIAPQMMGPKLLTNLHNLADFELMPSVGALSPEVILDLAGHEESTGKNLQGARQGALQALLAKQTEPMLAANLCTSLLGELSADAQEQEDLMLAAIAALNAHPRGLAF